MMPTSQVNSGTDGWLVRYKGLLDQPRCLQNRPPFSPSHLELDHCHCRKLNPASKRSRIGRCSWLMRDVCSLICLALIGLFRCGRSVASWLSVKESQRFAIGNARSLQGAGALGQVDNMSGLCGIVSGANRLSLRCRSRRRRDAAVHFSRGRRPLVYRPRQRLV